VAGPQSQLTGRHLAPESKPLLACLGMPGHAWACLISRTFQHSEGRGQAVEYRYSSAQATHRTLGLQPKDFRSPEDLDVFRERAEQYLTRSLGVPLDLLDLRLTHTEGRARLGLREGSTSFTTLRKEAIDLVTYDVNHKIQEYCDPREILYH
jgi:hypothetical protein